MKRLSWILAAFFGLVFLGATALNAGLIGKARGLLAESEIRPRTAIRSEPVRYHLVAIVPDTDDSLFEGLLKGVEDAAPASGAAVQVFRYAAQSSDEADRYLELAVRAKVDGVIMYAPRNGMDAERHAARSELAYRSGVVLVPVGTDEPPGVGGTFIGSGSLLQGREGGRLIRERLGSSARVGLILPASGDAGERAEDEPLYRGLVEALSRSPGARVSAAAEAQPGILSGEADAEAMLRSHPEINAILCPSARDTVGAAQVLIDRGEVGKVLLIGADNTEDIQRYIDKGVVAASVVRDSERIGHAAVLAFSRLKVRGGASGSVETGVLVVERKKAR
jgi:ribose transport system substrate-binding protein